MTKIGGQNSETSEPIATKFGMGDSHMEQSYMKGVWNVYEFIWSYKY